MGLKYRTEEEMQEIDKLIMLEETFRENIMDTESVKKSQQFYNLYVWGYDKIAVDGIWGSDTQDSYNEWKSNSKYIYGSDTFDFNPLDISKSYLESKEEDL